MADQFPLTLDQTTGRVRKMKSPDTVPLSVLPPSPVYTGSVTSTTTVTRTANTFATVGSMSFSMADTGNYLFVFNGDVDTGAVNGQAEIGVYQNGALITGTLRTAQISTAILGLITLSTNTWRGTVTCMTPKIPVVAGDVIDIRYRSVNGQTISVFHRVFNWTRVI